MKKIFLLAVIAVAVITTSCKKERVCSCDWTSTTTSSSPGGTVTTASSGTEKWTATDKVKKGWAKENAECYDRTESYTNIWGTTTQTTVREYTCELD
ncbi:MAG: hypothetical protein IPM51_05580 [Sphingobacteriaceae bacterium]|nr:hypothetical protein [Sphingobacteriaceae bacterium]